jgi:cysteinyl-tRNA synthetase
MAMDKLGEQFDIHGGGLDLQFPHHENEIAQSEGATGKTFANYWLHVGMLQVNNEKMSKSTGNFLTIADALKKHHPETIRYFLLSSHYRSALNYSDDNLHNASKALMRLYQSLKDINFVAADDQLMDQNWQKQFQQAMNDDFNTPTALAVLFQLSREINKTASPVLASTLKHLGGILGLLQEEPAAFLQASSVADFDIDTINILVAERIQARKQKDWTRADEIRIQLLNDGIEVEDGISGSSWRRTR